MSKKISFFWADRDRGVAPFHYKTTASFYASPAWIRLRNYKLSINPLCERCEGKGQTVPAAEVHHKTEISVNPDLALEISNLESLCKTCHSVESSKYLKGTGKKGGIVNIKNALNNGSNGKK